MGCTRQTTSPKISERPSLSILTPTTSLSSTPNSAAASGVRWMCLLATITPSEIVTCPLGPIKVHPGVFAKSPDSLTTPGKPIHLASVKEIST